MPPRSTKRRVPNGVVIRLRFVPPAAAAGPLVRISASGDAFLDRAVAILATDLDGRAAIAIDVAVAVVVLPEVTVNAVHPFFEVNVLEVNSLARLSVFRETNSGRQRK